MRHSHGQVSPLFHHKVVVQGRVLEPVAMNAIFGLLTRNGSKRLTEIHSRFDVLPVQPSAGNSRMSDNRADQARFPIGLNAVAFANWSSPVDDTHSVITSTL